jgi:hypothetical protein
LAQQVAPQQLVLVGAVRRVVADHCPVNSGGTSGITKYHAGLLAVPTVAI